MNWQKDLKKVIKLNEPLKNKTSFKIGGCAKFFYEPESLADLKLIISAAKKNRIKIFIIGAGSNILISDKGVNGLVLQLNSTFFKKITCDGNYLTVGSGIMLGGLLQVAQEKGLSGLEFLIGIPGTVGGALMMNAGAWNKSIGDLTEDVNVMDYRGKIELLRKKDIKFEYRSSGLEKYIILSVRLKLYKKNKEEIGRNLNKFLKARRTAQDIAFPNAGCVFKNPLGESAGKLMDLCGLKGRKIGGAFISAKHANFILNRNNAKAQDVLKLMKLAVRCVREKFKINLEPEIKIWQ